MQRGWTKVMYIIFMKNISKVAPMVPSSFFNFTFRVLPVKVPAIFLAGEGALRRD